jgi:DNA-binding transcriptional MerR regulator
MRIDELAQRAGVTSRNIRAYQARGLLPPPTLRGRTGYYGEEHLRRLELITDLQARGFSLEAIRHTLDAWSQGGDWSRLVGVHNLLTAPFTVDAPGGCPTFFFGARSPGRPADPRVFDRGVYLGLLVPDDGGFVAPSPMLIEAGAQLVDAGIPLAAVLDVVAFIRPRVAGIARDFIALVADHLVSPLLDEMTRPEDADAGIESVNRLRPIALEVVRPFLAQELSAAIDEAVAARADRVEQRG